MTLSYGSWLTQVRKCRYTKRGVLGWAIGLCQRGLSRVSCRAYIAPSSTQADLALVSCARETLYECSVGVFRGLEADRPFNGLTRFEFRRLRLRKTCIQCTGRKVWQFSNEEKLPNAPERPQTCSDWLPNADGSGHGSLFEMLRDDFAKLTQGMFDFPKTLTYIVEPESATFGADRQFYNKGSIGLDTNPKWRVTSWTHSVRR